jgi:transcriptional regulator with XRE-family HTH domain
MSYAYPTATVSDAPELSLLGNGGDSENLPAPHDIREFFVETTPVPQAERPVSCQSVIEKSGESKQRRRDAVSRTAPPTDAKTPKLHRVAEVRAQQGVSERTIARRLGIDVKSYRRLEDPTRDLKISELHALTEALEVPLIDLVEDRQALSRPVEERAKLVKVMKTAVAMRETKASLRVQRMAQMLCEQLVELMPELKEVSGWPQFGSRRGQSAVGRTLIQQIDTSQIGYHE